MFFNEEECFGLLFLEVGTLCGRCTDGHLLRRVEPFNRPPFHLRCDVFFVSIATRVVWRPTMTARQDLGFSQLWS